MDEYWLINHQLVQDSARPVSAQKRDLRLPCKCYQRQKTSSMRRGWVCDLLGGLLYGPGHFGPFWGLLQLCHSNRRLLWAFQPSPFGGEPGSSTHAPRIRTRRAAISRGSPGNHLGNGKSYQLSLYSAVFHSRSVDSCSDMERRHRRNNLMLE